MMLPYSYARQDARKEDMNVNAGDQVYLCRICKKNMTKARKKLDRENQEGEVLTAIEFRVPVCPPGACCICLAEDPDHELSFTTRISIYIMMDIYADQGTRICRHHVDLSSLMMKECPEAKSIQCQTALIRMSSADISKWIQETRQQAVYYKNKDVDMANYFLAMENDDFQTIFGIQKDQFEDMFACVARYRSPTGQVCSKKSILLFLLKLRQADSLTYLKALFRFKSKGAVSSQIRVARMALTSLFVPRHLGVRNFTRESMTPHVTNLARTLHVPDGDPNKIVLTIDGTYLYLNKSHNFTELKRTFSKHKARHLVKMNMCVMPDGFILEAHGPYYADSKNTDAATLRHDLEGDITGLKEFLQDGDVVVVDRGYRDIITYLEGLGLSTQMPAFLRRGEKQHSTEEANASRLVTKTRWIVEVRHGHIKQIFKFFNKTIAAGNAPYAGEYFRIACAIVNAYRPCIHTNDDTEQNGLQLLRRRNVNNDLMDYVLEQDMVKKRAQWIRMQDFQLEEFPRMSLDDLRSLTLGEYQIRQAAGYNAEVEERTEGREFQIHRHDETLLRGRLFSRHKSSTEYYQFIRFVPSQNGSSGIQGWYCTCISGARTVGMCSHLSAILWHLCIDRHTPGKRRPKRRLLGIALDAGGRDSTE